MSSSTDIPTDVVTDIPEKTWDIPFSSGTYLHDLFEEILRENRDVIMIIDDYYGRRGTGKTVASLMTGDGMDQNHGLTWDKCTLQPERIRNAYSNQPMRSGLVMDEAEFGASNRDPMTRTNKALREICSMGRVEQKYLIVNTPIKSFIDTDLQKLADVWISMVRKGKGLVHELKWEPYSQTLLTPKKQWIEFDDIPKNTDLRNVYNKLTEEKRKYIGGEEGDQFIEMPKHKEELKKEREKVERRTRNEIIRRIYNNQEIVDECGVSQRMIGESVGITQQQVGNIIRGDA